ncbi:MAG: glucosamine-6-phosphate deaminase [Breznakia sp.]
MNVIVCKSYEEASEKAYEVVKEVVVKKPNAVLGFATGSSPIGLYKNMIAGYKANDISYKDVVTFNLDEYVGLAQSHSESYWTFMHENLFNGIDVKAENIHLPYGNSEEDCIAYEKAMSDYQIDIQVLGIGGNGHIGFNEPGTPFAKETHIVTLTQETRDANARFFDGDMTQVPKEAITMGIATIMKAKKIVLIASGENKADAVKAMVEGTIEESMPASILQNHPDVVVVVDEAAAAKLSK